MKKYTYVWRIFLFLCLISVLGFAEVQDSLKVIPEVTSKIKVDGNLDEPLWKEALVLTLNYEVEPGENIPPPVKTEVLLAYGPKHIYVAFKAFDPKPGEIRARYTDRDNIDNEDYVGIVLDTFNDSRRAYNFYCNPFGIQSDHVTGMIFGEEEWDGIWDSAGKITPTGYTVEMSIPFTSLRFQSKKKNQIWGIDAVRSYPRSLSHLIGLFPRDRSNNCYMCQANKVIGFKGAKPGINLEFDPTLSAITTREREQFPDGKFVKKTGKVNPGLTARWSFTPSMTLNAAINPDFSHVEADYAQLDINTQFVLFYPEKRPFFLEGLSFFRSRFYAVYTRSIIEPEWGIKLTGKMGKQAIGFFTVQDSVTNLVFPGSESTDVTSLNMKSIGTVFRYRRDIGRSSNLGFIVTDREGTDYYNRVAGIDGDLRFTKKDRIFFQMLGTQTSYPDYVSYQFDQPLGRFNGGAFDVYYSHSTRKVQVYGHYQGANPNFRTDLGFVDQTGIKLYRGGGLYTWRRNPGHWYTLFRIEGNYYHLTDSDDHLLQKRFRTVLTYNGPLQSSLAVQLNLGKQTYLGNSFDDKNCTVTAQIRPSGSLYLWLNGAFGDQVDYTNVQAGTRFRLNPGIEYNMGRHLYLSLDHLFERLTVDGGRLYTANLSNIRMVFQFNRRAFLRAILQYANYNYNTELYLRPRDPEAKKLFSQILFSYKINPQTVLFLGYSDDHFGYSNVPLTQNNYTLFLKVGYALVL